MVASSDSVAVGALAVVLIILGGELVECSARVERSAFCHVGVRLNGLSVPAPYRIGDYLPLDWSKVVSWQNPSDSVINWNTTS